MVPLSDRSFQQPTAILSKSIQEKIFAKNQSVKPLNQLMQFDSDDDNQNDFLTNKKQKIESTPRSYLTDQEDPVKVTRLSKKQQFSKAKIRLEREESPNSSNSSLAPPVTRVVTSAHSPVNPVRLTLSAQTKEMTSLDFLPLPLHDESKKKEDPFLVALPPVPFIRQPTTELQFGSKLQLDPRPLQPKKTMTFDSLIPSRGNSDIDTSTPILINDPNFSRGNNKKSFFPNQINKIYPVAPNNDKFSQFKTANLNDISDTSFTASLFGDKKEATQSKPFSAKFTRTVDANRNTQKSSLNNAETNSIESFTADSEVFSMKERKSPPDTKTAKK